MGAVNTTYTFTATDTITSTKMNNIIDQTTITDDAIIGTTLEVASGQLKVRALGITSNEIANGQVTSDKIADGTIVNADISPTAAIAGTKISPAFGSQTVTATGDIELSGTASDYTVVSLNNGSGVAVHLNANGNSEGNIRTVTNHPLTLSTNNTERMRITAAGNVGIGTSSPSYPLQVVGSASFGSSSNQSTGTAVIYNDGNNVTIEAIAGNNNSVKRNIMLATYGGNVGVGKNPTTKLDVNGTVTATAFAGPITGDVTGNASSATTASTVSNGAITAAKLDGAQSGSAPIFGVRAWVSFNGVGTIGTNMTIRGQGNVSSVNKLGTGRYRVTFATPMQDANYATIAGSDANSPHKIAGVIAQDASYVDIAYSQINTSTARDDADWGQVTIIR